MRCGLVWRGEESWSAGEEGDGMEEDRTGVWAVAWPGSLPGPWPGAAVRDGPSALHGERDRPDGAAATAALISDSATWASRILFGIA